jgi:hypothetical protein
MVLAIVLFAIVFGWLIYKWTVYALPCFAGLCTAQLAFTTGAGWLGSAVVWTVTALTIFKVIRSLYTTATHPILRALLSIVFSTPSAVVAYFIFDDLSAGQVPSEVWRQALCIFASGVIGLFAFARLSEPDPE